MANIAEQKERSKHNLNDQPMQWQCKCSVLGDCYDLSYTLLAGLINSNKETYLLTKFCPPPLCALTPDVPLDMFFFLLKKNFKKLFFSVTVFSFPKIQHDNDIYNMNRQNGKCTKIISYFNIENKLVKINKATSLILFVSGLTNVLTWTQTKQSKNNQQQ